MRTWHVSLKSTTMMTGAQNVLILAHRINLYPGLRETGAMCALKALLLLIHNNFLSAVYYTLPSIFTQDIGGGRFRILGGGGGARFRILGGGGGKV